MARKSIGPMWVFASLLLASCGGTGTRTASHGTLGNRGVTSASSQRDYPGADLGLPAVAPGFVRYETQPVAVGAGEDGMWAEWVAPPLESDMDVVEVTGLQSKGGHHALLYATTNIQPVGTSRTWQDGDQLTSRTAGGIGGEGDDAIQLPPGVVFRIPKGSALLIQSHYLNANNDTIEGRSVLDVKLAPADPSAQVAGLLASTTLKISIPPDATTVTDVSCTLQRDLRVLMYANHMHNWGVSASTELISADGTSTPLKLDPAWDPSWAFHPNYTRFTLQTPALLPAGSTIHTTCTWSNNKTTALSFPDEMCVFAGFYIGESDATCVDGNWQ
jgi:hypothetical protein